MKKVFIAFGAVVLTAAGVFAGRETSRRADPAELYIKHPVTNVCTRINSNVSAGLLSTTAVGASATIKSNNNTVYDLFEQRTGAGVCQIPVYLRTP